MYTHSKWRIEKYRHSLVSPKYVCALTFWIKIWMKIYSTVETDETGCIPQFAGTCGVLVENDLSRKLDQMGLDYDHVHKAAPRLLYCSISGTYLWLCPHLSTHSFQITPPLDWTQHTPFCNSIYVIYMYKILSVRKPGNTLHCCPYY